MERPSQGEDPWRTTAELLREKAAAAEIAHKAAMTERSRQEAEALERTSEGQRRIDGFLSRMRDAGNPGCAEHDLTIVGRRDKMIRRRADIGDTLRDEDPDELIVLGWVIEDRSHRVQPRDSPTGREGWYTSHTILTTDGDAFDKPDRSPGGGFGRSRLDPAEVTMEMLVGTLIRNGVEV